MGELTREYVNSPIFLFDAYLSASEVETTLLAFVFDVAFSLESQVVQHFGKHLFHGFVPSEQGSIAVVGTADGHEAIVGNINRRAVAMAGVGRRIFVASL